MIDTSKVHIVSEESFMYSVILFLKPPSKREIIKHLKKNLLNYDEKRVDEIIADIKAYARKPHATTYTMGGIVLIVFHNWENSSFNYGTLVHEIFHAVDITLRGRGITLSDDSDEVYAYHMGYFTRNFLDKIWSD